MPVDTSPGPGNENTSCGAVEHHFSLYPRYTRAYKMADPQLTNVVSVGGNAISAFLSWRLSATNACDVTLVWKNGFEAVAQYGLSFK